MGVGVIADQFSLLARNCTRCVPSAVSGMGVANAWRYLRAP